MAEMISKCVLAGRIQLRQKVSLKEANIIIVLLKYKVQSMICLFSSLTITYNH